MAYQEGVRRATRRVLFVRPNVLVVQDIARLDEPETGVRSWNSLTEWEVLDGRTCRARAGDVAVRLTCLAGEAAEPAAGQDSVSREGGRVVPVYRATFTSPAARAHRMITIIEAIGPKGKGDPATVRVLDADRPLIEIEQGERTTRVTAARTLPADSLWGCSTDGSLAFVVRQKGKVVAAGAFEATHIKTPHDRKVGSGFIHIVAAKVVDERPR